MAETTDKTGEQMRGVMTVRGDGLLPPPVGTSDWARFSRDSYCVDKTLILKDLIDSRSRVVLFTRPRRFGKTTMLEMIRAFYEPETLVDGRGMVKTEEFFIDKKIWFADGGKYRAEQKIMSVAAERNLRIMLHGGSDVGCRPYELAKVAHAFPSVRLSDKEA